MMFTDCPPQFSLSGLGCKPSPSAFPAGLSLDELWPPSNHHPAPLSAWPHINFPASPPFLLELGLQETPFASSLLVVFMHTASSTTNSKIFWKKVAGLRFVSKEEELQLPTAHLRIQENSLIYTLHHNSSDEGSSLCVTKSRAQTISQKKTPNN